MKLPALIFAALMISSGLEQAGAAALRPSVTIDAEVVRLGDLFLDTGPKAERIVAAAPAPGHSELYTAHRLRAIADDAGLGWMPKSRYEKVLIERSGRLIPTAEIEQALRAALDAAGALRGRRIALAKRDLVLHAALDADEPFRVADMRYNETSGRFAAIVEVATGRKSAERTTVAGNLYVVARVPVLARPLQRGEIVRESDIDTVELPKATVPRNAVLDKTRIVGKASRRLLRAGVPLNPADLQAPVVVPKGSLVTIMLRTERMLLTAQGKALEDGAEGETIRVLNTRSRATIEGTVAGPGKIAIAFHIANR